MGETNNGKHKGTLHAYHVSGEYENNPVKLLASQIVIHAIEDWRSLIKSKDWLNDEPNKHCNFNELRLFFRGEWCAFLMQDFDIEPAAILDTLEKELEAAQRSSEADNRKRVKFRA